MLDVKVDVICKNCGKEFDEVDLSLEVVDSSEREMGSETQHSGEVEFSCDGCNEDIACNIDVWEYPVGSVNMTDSSNYHNVEKDSVSISAEFTS